MLAGDDPRDRHNVAFDGRGGTVNRVRLPAIWTAVSVCCDDVHATPSQMICALTSAQPISLSTRSCGSLKWTFRPSRDRVSRSWHAA
jgi:hypothetical protein